jgi:hypothetical protein
MLHNMKMTVESCLAFLPIYPKKGEEVEKAMFIFVKDQ